MNKLMWKPSEELIKNSSMTKYRHWLKGKRDLFFKDYGDLHRWSVESPSEFWSSLFDYFGLVYEGDPSIAFNGRGFDDYGWFPDVRLNFAENLLKRGEDNHRALSWFHETGREQDLSYEELRNQAGALASTLSQWVGEGDVVACYMPNVSETVVTMLATSSLGGVFTSTSSDFGQEGVLDRFGQSKPKVLVAAVSYTYNGKVFDLREKIASIVKALPDVEKVILVDFLGEKLEGEVIVERSLNWEEAVSESAPLNFKRVPFQAPLYIMYSSGTTGKPKCIVHTVGGTLLQHVKELGLHINVGPDKNLFYFTTCGWMMWNWMASGLFFGGTVSLYEGSPGFPSLKEFFKKVDDRKINIYGTSPKFLKALEDSGYDNDFKFENLESILSTGAPLLPEQFDFIYEKIKKDVHVGSICGGTDIIGCFMLGNPTIPVHRGEIQCLGLGMDVACLDENGEAVFDKEGELACRQSFPSRPLCFLNDENNERINEAYFNRYPGIWHHGDFVRITDTGGVVVYGRSDATLNPGGVRIGTAEIYRQTEQLDFLVDSLCIGRPKDGDVEVVLFVTLKEGLELNTERIKEIKNKIRSNTTPRHVPAEVYQVGGIPYTRSGKKMELAVSRILAGRALTNIEAVANPECLADYEKYKG